MNKKNILITGCSTGIGYKTALYLRQRGIQVLTSARRQEDVEQLRKEGFWSCRLDLDDSNSIQTAFDAVKEQTGEKLYAVFNNAGDGHPGYISDITRESLEEQFKTNVFGTHELMVKALHLMKKNGEGRIINNTSVLGFVSVKGRGAYCASKFALEALSSALRRELKEWNKPIYVSVVQPGPIVSAFRENAVENLKKYVDIKNSDRRELYESKLKPQKRLLGTLKEEAVARKVYHALTASKPRAYYRVTVHTHIAFYIKKWLPNCWQDVILSKF